MKSQSFPVTLFQQRVYDFVRKVPKGKTVTYREVASGIGKPKACRAVGNALNKNPFSFRLGGDVPCHRVIRSDGSVGGFASGTKQKLTLLKKEGWKSKFLSKSGTIGHKNLSRSLELNNLKSGATIT